MAYSECNAGSGDTRSFTRNVLPCVSCENSIMEAIAKQVDHFVNKSRPFETCVTVQLCRKNVREGNAHIVEASLCKKPRASKESDVNNIEDVEMVNDEHFDVQHQQPRYAETKFSFSNESVSTLRPIIALERLPKDLIFNIPQSTPKGTDATVEVSQVVLAVDIHQQPDCSEHLNGVMLTSAEGSACNIGHKIAKLERRLVERVAPSQRAISNMRNCSEKGTSKNSSAIEYGRHEQKKRFGTPDSAVEIKLSETRAGLEVQGCLTELTSCRNVSGPEMQDPVEHANTKSDKMECNLMEKDSVNTKANRERNKEKGKGSDEVVIAAVRDGDGCVIAKDIMSPQTKRKNDMDIINGSDSDVEGDDSCIIVETESENPMFLQPKGAAAPISSMCATDIQNVVTSSQLPSAMLANEHVVEVKSQLTYSESFNQFVSNSSNKNNSGNVFLRGPSKGTSLHKMGLVSSLDAAAGPRATKQVPLVSAMTFELRPVAKFVMDVGANLVGARICEEVIKNQSSDLKKLSQDDKVKYDFVNSSYQRFVNNTAAFRNSTSALHQCRCQQFYSATRNELAHHLYHLHPKIVEDNSKRVCRWVYSCCLCMTMNFSSSEELFMHMFKVHNKMVKVETVKTMNQCQFCGIEMKSLLSFKGHVFQCGLHFKDHINLAPSTLDGDIPIWNLCNRLQENAKTSAKSHELGRNTNLGSFPINHSKKNSKNSTQKNAHVLEKNTALGTITFNHKQPAVFAAASPVNCVRPMIVPQAHYRANSNPLQDNRVKSSVFFSRAPRQNLRADVPIRMLLVESLQNHSKGMANIVRPSTMEQSTTYPMYFAQKNGTTVGRIQEQQQNCSQGLMIATPNVLVFPVLSSQSCTSSSTTALPQESTATNLSVITSLSSVQPATLSSSSSAAAFPCDSARRYSGVSQLSLSTENEVYLCYLCDLNFANYECLNKHIATTHKLISPLIVGLTSAVQDDCGDRTKQVIPETVCEVCDSTLATSVDLFYHLSKYHNVTLSMSKFFGPENSRFFECSYCVRRFFSQIGLSRHTRSAHPCSALLYRCCLCCKTLTRILEHLSVTHKITLGDMFKTYSCMICIVETGGSDGLRRHMLEHHKELFPSAMVLTEMLEKCHAVSINNGLSQSPLSLSVINRPDCNISSPGEISRVMVDACTTRMNSEKASEKSLKHMSSFQSESLTKISDEQKLTAAKNLKRKFRCSKCGISFDHRRSWWRHFKTKHRSSCEPCLICGKMEQSGRALLLHTYYMHIRECSVALERLNKS